MTRDEHFAAREEANQLHRELRDAVDNGYRLREGLRQLIAQCEETDWMGPAGKMDAALDDARALLDAAREGGE